MNAGFMGFRFETKAGYVIIVMQKASLTASNFGVIPFEKVLGILGLLLGVEECILVVLSVLSQGCSLYW